MDNKWIAVTERLPEYEPVLADGTFSVNVWITNGEIVTIGYYNYILDEWTIEDVMVEDFGPVTHFQTIPKRPLPPAPTDREGLK